MGSSETCPYCMQRADRCACEDPRIVGYENATPTPPAPADDATRHESASAEAMREACAKACRKVANGTRRPSGQSSSTLSRLFAIAEGAYMCEKAIRALPLPARREEAVVEARDAERFRWLMSRNFGFAFDAEKCGISTGRWGKWPEDPDAQRAMIDRAIAYYAALRGTKGGDK